MKLKKLLISMISCFLFMFALNVPASANKINYGVVELYTEKAQNQLTFSAHTKVGNNTSSKLVSTGYMLTPYGEAAKTFTVTGSSSSSYIIDQPLTSSSASKWTYIESTHTVGGSYAGMTTDGARVYG